MSNEEIVKAFAFEGRAVRVELIEGEPWWVAKDVAVALGYAETSVANNMSNLVAKVPAEWRGNKPFLTPGGTQEILCLSEQGLYSFLARSNMEAAVPFQKWIAGEVLPSIRKTGKYSVVPVDPTALGLPDFNDPFAAAEAWAKEGRGRVAAEEQAKGVAA